MGWGRKGIFLSAVVGIALLQNVVWGDKDTTTTNGGRHQTQPHPLDPLSALEISQTSATVKSSNPGVQWVFIWVTLKEPEKSLLLPYFLSNTEPPPGTIPRRSIAVVLNPITGVSFEGVVNLGTNSLEDWKQLPEDVDTMFASDEMSAISDMVLQDPSVLQRLALYGPFYGNSSNVVTDVWKYGYKADKPEYAGRRLAQVFFYGRNFDHDNFYAHPMGFAAVVDTLRQEVLEIEEIPIQSDFDTTNREGDEVPVGTGNYDPTISGRWYRDDISTITILQENGPSFTIEGNVLKWQKFKMRLGRNGREGLTLHNVNYNDTSSGTVRPLLYRASLSELFVPYGDPRPPYHRKMALDVGEYGMGFSASEMRAPDGCRGSVYFLDVINNDMSGQPWTVKNAFCIYEEDAGILWRKMDPVTRRVVTARSQRLVLTFIATVSNYDYQFKWAFYQDASIRVEMVLTGIVSQNLLGTDATPGGHGTITSPHINSQFHQHFFAVRLDTEIDGNRNTVSTVDIVPDDIPAGAPNHPYGNAFSVNETVLETAGQGRSRTQPDTARSWRVTGEPTNVNPISGGPKGWKLIPDHVARLMMSKDSILHEKNAFVDYDVWVTPYQEDQLYAAGTYLNSSGLPQWVGDDPGASIVNEDIVLWHVFGVTHVVRVEDLPVMPCESIGFWFKPTNFFTENPSTDVEPTVHESETSRRAGRVNK